MDFPTDIASLASQVEGVVAVDPIPSEVTFLWFGLFDLRTGDEEGFYISGGTGTNPDRDQRRIYWPEGRYLTSRVLEAIKATIMQVERSARHKGKNSQTNTAFWTTRTCSAPPPYSRDSWSER
jgi:hypothetical protein